MQLFTGIGLMSGTSLDGIDIALCHFWQEDLLWKYDIEVAKTYNYSDEWRNRLLELPNTSAYDYAKTNIDYGHYLGLTLRKFIVEFCKSPNRDSSSVTSGSQSQSGNIPDVVFDFVSSHGHTIFHQPERHFTAQIGDGETISTYLTRPLITNFRNKDVALGGQGAPLVPVGERDLFTGVNLFLNLGGIANLSILPDKNSHFQLSTWKKNAHEYTAYDICPCNIVLNFLANKLGLDYDDKGAEARKGIIIPELLNYLEDLPFYQLFPPRTLGREWVEEEIISKINENNHLNNSINNLLHTFCHHIVKRIMFEVEKFNLKNTKILITGGGALNQFLMEILTNELAKCEIEVIQADKKLIEYKEALIFAYLGLLSLLGQENTLKSVTGAIRSTVSGSIHSPAYDEKHTDGLRAFLNKKILSFN